MNQRWSIIRRLGQTSSAAVKCARHSSFTPAGVHAAVDAILAEAAANPVTTWSEPYHGDLIPDVDYLSGVECDMRAEREAAV